MPIASSETRPMKPTGWSRLNVTLHWLIVALVVAQALNHEAMISLWDSTLKDTAISSGDTFVGWFHIVAGTTIFLAALIRLVDRFVAGRPAYPEGDPIWSSWLARATHFLLYTVLLVMPLLGLAAWVTGNDAIAGYHTFLWVPLLVLIGLHVVGALAQHFVFRTAALRQILSLKGRRG